jgi:benzoyl-CoA reductase/2-hydroxyglutaryl-CoA dehydratase subunit BcrC/BadD/HgdB
MQQGALRMNNKFHFENCHPDLSDPLVGWVCSYTPEELILAAGFTPYRFEAAAVPNGAEAYLPANLCPYTRAILDAGLTASPGNLRGMVFVNSCDAMRRLADAWERNSSIPILHRLDFPRRHDAVAEDYLEARFREFVGVLGRYAGHPVREDDILSAIEVVNESRRLMCRIAELRRLSGAYLSGGDFSDIANDCVHSDKRRFNIEARRFIESYNRTNRDQDALPRVILCGCAVTGREIQELIEKCGVRVAGDDLCTGERLFDGLIDTSLDPLRGIAQRYLRRRACSRMQGIAARTGNLVDLVDRFGADGIIFMTLKFCDLVQSDLPRLRQAAHDRGIPFLQIERDSLNGTSGQMLTRIEAFAEILGNRK